VLTVFFIFSTIVVVLVVTALRPPMMNRHTALRPPWFPVMLTSELAPVLLIPSAAVTIAARLAGWTDGPLGQLGLWFSVASILGLGWLIANAFRTAKATDSAFATSEVSGPTRVSVARALWPDPYRVPSDVVVTHAVAYIEGQHLDIYERKGSATGQRPAMIQIHGGSWSGGNRAQQARPLIHALAQGDWSVFSIDYPLVPDVAFPDNLLAVHSAIAWVRRNADELRIDRSRIFLTGGSSGAHLAALAALTDTHAEWGTREASDPPIAGAVTFYGVYDLLDRHDIRDDWLVVSEGLVRADRTLQPERFRNASPIDYVAADAPPFIVIHGRHDSLVPYAESVYFVDALKSVSAGGVDLLLLPGASHSFDSIPSIRTQLLVHRLVDHLATVGRSHR
jgi:acetyl esterase/lipase